jgi:hypothetical protein
VVPTTKTKQQGAGVSYKAFLKSLSLCLVTTWICEVSNSAMFRVLSVGHENYHIDSFKHLDTEVLTV